MRATRNRHLKATGHPIAGRLVFVLVLASLSNAAFLVGATVIDGLQFRHLSGQPELLDWLMLVLSYLFFAAPLMAVFVVPLGFAGWWGLRRFDVLKWWIAAPAGFLIGLALSGVIPLLPSEVLVSQVSSPLREWASALGGAASGLVIWWLGRPGASG